MQTILGAGGAIGKELAKELKNYTSSIRLVSRNPQKINETDTLFPADLTKAEEVDKAVEGSEIVYLTVGLQYNLKVWENTWPQLMANVISSCKKHKAKLVFFDNVYMYDPNHMNNMTEETPVNPSSKKGKIRAEIAEMILKEVKAGSLTALIARSADFIGDKNSVLVETVYKNLLKGKRANWLIDANKIHTFTFVPDAAKATALLGNTWDAYHQVWHLPTDNTLLTGKQWIELIARELNVAPKYNVLSPWMLGLLGLFIPVLKEFKEMAYQNDRDYLFNSKKFETRFKYIPAKPEEMIKYLVKNIK